MLGRSAGRPKKQRIRWCMEKMPPKRRSNAGGVENLAISPSHARDICKMKMDELQ
jgi:hypothetical protein